MRIILCLLGFIFLCGCNKWQHVSVRNNYLSKQSLASYRVATPDPCLNCPPMGQQLIISWRFPYHYLYYNNFHLSLKVRYGDRSEEIENIPIAKSLGYYVFSLQGEKFFDKGGIRTYKIDVIGNEKILDEWKHHLWIDLITFECQD